MTDLTNMSVDELRDEMCVHCATDHQIAPFDEMARRLREAQERITFLENGNKVLIDISNDERCQWKPFAEDAEKRAQQAESALLACRHTLIEIAKAPPTESLPSATGDPRVTEQFWKPVALAREFLANPSHSTGSKIMAVVEAAKRLINPPITSATYMVVHGTEQVCKPDYAALEHAVHALEAKHD